MASAGGEPLLSRSRSRARGWWVVIAVVAIVVLDQLTKSWAVAALADGPIEIVGRHVELVLTRNGGSAFSNFQGLTPVLAIAAVIVTVVLVRAVQRATDRVVLIGLVLVLGGALGNLTDRFARSPGFLRGHVVDFVAVGWWPVFNLADSCITIGAILLVVRTLFPARTPAPDRPEPHPHG